MIKLISVEKLKIGMFVVLPLNWLEHPFFINKFLLKNETELMKLRQCGITQVKVDFSRSTCELEPEFSSIVCINDDEGLLGETLLLAAQDKTEPPDVKAKHIYESSKQLLSSLFESPNPLTIKSVKDTISETINFLIEDTETSKYLSLVTQHDYYTATHSVNVGVYGLALASRIYKNNKSHQLAEIGTAFFMHDLGKVSIEQSIINKPGKLDPIELAQMRMHPTEGCRILKEADCLTETCAIIALQHHEREDGSGYPFGLKHDEIHDYARICSIADVFDALTSERSYKAQLPLFEALCIMRDEMINHFHRELFEEFVLLFTEQKLKVA